MLASKLTRRVTLGGLSLAALGALTGGAAQVHSVHEFAPNERIQVLTWTEDVVHWYGGSWTGGMQAAAGHVEGGFEDWRLPTVAELQAALQDGSWGQDVDGGAGTFRHWTSKSQGIWAWAVTVVKDADGYPIASQSGAAKKYLKTGNLYGAKFVRP